MKKAGLIAIMAFCFLSIIYPQNSTVLTLNGSNYVRIPNGTAPIDGRSTFTIELWLKTTNYDRDPFGTVGTGAQANPTAFLYINNSRVIAFRWGGETLDKIINTATLYPNDGAWHHIAVVVTAGSSNDLIYIDGSPAAMNDNDLGTAASLGLTMDFGRSNFVNFIGSMDDIRFWSTARTQSEIQNNMNRTLTGNESGLTGYWKFDETPASNQNVLDSQTNTTVHNGFLGATSSAEGSDPVRNNDSSLPLPVELISFSASSFSGTVELKWTTAIEKNNYGFEVERSSSGTASGKDWSVAGFVGGSGSSNSVKEYSFTDKNLADGKYYYRLKQIDNDGQFEYSPSIEVVVAKPAEFSLQQNYPNPFNPVTTISYSLPEESNVQIILFNILGEELTKLVDEVKQPGLYSINFNAEDLESGVYFYRIKAGDFIDTKKLSLMK